MASGSSSSTTNGPAHQRVPHQHLHRRPQPACRHDAISPARPPAPSPPWPSPYRPPANTLPPPSPPAASRRLLLRHHHRPVSEQRPSSSIPAAGGRHLCGRLRCNNYLYCAGTAGLGVFSVTSAGAVTPLKTYTLATPRVRRHRTSAAPPPSSTSATSPTAPSRASPSAPTASSPP